ncbi:hypothetical protein BT96DRAFT_1086661 [Gymnopus androsaceus JB14]|uniref:Uncharacterized protein n=1 Tax=Gymnopus androsaceus JB14 TaxID=1447944 RepID=A0A6A4GKJ7_9AGAR|nr:hypothetical protein BT96DRAFT_1086661 [Gymnopus androsaceus JB14]
MPKEQTDAYLRTEMYVNLAVKSFTEVALEVVAETGEVIPAPGLGVVAKLLSSIWDAVDDVGICRDHANIALCSCFRFSSPTNLRVYVELPAAQTFSSLYTTKLMNKGIKAKELDKPLKRLESSSNLILDLMLELRDRPFWEWFVKQDEILYEIERCLDLLNDCIVIFNIFILARIEKTLYVPLTNLPKQLRGPYLRVRRMHNP